MRKILFTAIVGGMSLFLLTGFVGCEPTGKVDVSVVLPKVPARYRQCFASVVPIPTGSLSRADVARLVAQFRRSDVAKTQCGKDLIAWYDNVVVVYGRKR